MYRALVRHIVDMTEAADTCGERLRIEAAGRTWLIERTADLETLWERMDDEDLDEDERMPYWAEVWPASVLMARHMAAHARELRGAACLDLGCGLGLTALVGASLGARVVAVDYEAEALGWARKNARLNNVPDPLWAVMDWRFPGLRARSFDFIWGGDILYEKRFFDPVRRLLAHALAPGGRIWIGEPQRTVSRPVWDELASYGFSSRRVTVEKVALGGQNATVNLWELTL